MSTIPLTKTVVSLEKASSIRNSIKRAELLSDMGRLATGSDAGLLTALLSDPEISNPIYTLPTVINSDTVAEFVSQHLEEREKGVGLLMISVDEKGLASSYYDIQFWPDYGACELGGAVRTNLQNSGQGVFGAIKAFDWLFDTIGVDLICETAAVDNYRTARLLEKIGFVYMGEIESELPEGGVRPSKYWELKRNDWTEVKRNGGLQSLVPKGS